MPQNEWYKKWFDSPYYHKLYFEENEQTAKDFIRKLIDHLKVQPGSRVLDIACGRGRHSRLLAGHGLDVSGIDISADSIQYANQFEGEKLHFYVHDLRLPFWVNYFDYAFNFFTSFGYFSTRREHDDAIRTVASSLKPKGILLFDYLNVHYVEDHLVHNEVRNIGETKFEIHRWQDEQFFYKKITITSPELTRPEEHTEKVVKFSLGDFTDMLSFQKMQVTEVFGDYQLYPYHVRNTPRMIVAATKM